jgi:hypothetical protein
MSQEKNKRFLIVFLVLALLSTLALAHDKNQKNATYINDFSYILPAEAQDVDDIDSPSDNVVLAAVQFTREGRAFASRFTTESALPCSRLSTSGCVCLSAMGSAVKDNNSSVPKAPIKLQLRN